jgi:flagellar basal-body rod protein FlgF
MDRLIYTAMTGAAHVLERQAAVTQNLANSSTTGYRAATNAFRAVPLAGDGLQTRAFVVDSVTGYDPTPGTLASTGRQLDVAIAGSGWIAVQRPDGKEGYTRDGSLEISTAGVLQTKSGMPVVGDEGPITVPPDTQVTIAKDGTVSTVPNGDMPLQVLTIGRIKLVNPPDGQMTRGDDGLFRTTNGVPAEADANVAVVAGSLENSNVNVVDAMVNMISLARQFDLQMQVLKHASSNDQQASQILTVS